jgi:hypothetical protein
MTEMPSEAPDLTQEERNATRALGAEVPDDLRSAFHQRLAAWKATWTSPELALSSDTHDFTRGPEFEAIVDLGPAAIPLALEQMAHEPDGFFLLAALERWQERDDLVATTAKYPLESQQSRARRAVREAVALG